MTETLGLIVGAVLTLMVFSYLLGDNVLYRWALALLVGAAAGYAVGVAARYVLNDWIVGALAAQGAPDSLAYAVPLVLGALLLLKGFPPTRFLGRIAVIGNSSLGYLVGVGAAVAVSGALVGTLIPQVTVTGEALRIDEGGLAIAQGAVVLLGTVLGLYYFHTRPHTHRDAPPSKTPVQQKTERLGMAFIAIALGTAFSGALTSALTALVLRLWQLVELAERLISLVAG